MLDDRLFLKARRIIETLQGAGHQGYLCGGSVRDMLLGLPAKDYDVVTSAEPATVEALFPRTVPVGKQFGVIRVMDGEDCFEVATFREDFEYIDGRRPAGVRFASIEDDATRRDFTINGMYFDPVTEAFVDLVGGQVDLQAGLIRAIGDPEARFSEDFLRLLRAVRFACQLGFEIEDSAWQAIRSNARGLDGISGERITAELERILTGPDPARGVRLLAESGMLAVIAPELAVSDSTLAHVTLALTHLGCPQIELAMAVLCHELDDAALGALLGRMRFRGKANRCIERLVADRRVLADLDLGQQARLKRILREPHADQLLELMRVDGLASDGLLGRYHDLRLRLQRWRQQDCLWPASLLDGQGLISMGYPRGQLFGQILRSLEDAQLRGELTTAEAASSWVRSNWKIVLILWLCWLVPGCSSAPPLPQSSGELSTSQQTANIAGAPLRLLGAAVVLPLKLLIYDGPRRLWAMTVGQDEFDRALAALEDPQPAIRYRAAQAFVTSAATVREPRRRLALAAALVRRLEDEQSTIRNQAVLALGQLGERWVVSRVVRLLKAPDDQLRGSAVIALGQIGDPRVGPLLIQLYDSPWGESWFVRSALIQAAGKLSLIALLPKIRAQLANPDPAGEWLAQVVCIQALGRLGDDSDARRLKPLLRHHNEYVRTAAAMSLGRLGQPGELARMLPRATVARHQLPLILALGRHGQASDRGVIGPFLDSPDPTVRAHAACALVDLGDPRGVEGLIQGLSSQDVYERFVCLGRLEQLSGLDHGFAAKKWGAWWRSNHKTVKLGRHRP